MSRPIAGLTVLFVVPALAVACSICEGQATRQTIRQDTLSAQYVFLGTMSNPRVNAAGSNGITGGATDFTVEQVVRTEKPAASGIKQFTIPGYIPVDDKNPPKYLVFCDEQRGKLDPYRAVPLKAGAFVDYLKAAIAIDGKDTPKLLAHAGPFLDSADPDLATEAYTEFARANDADVLRAAKALAPDRIRNLLDDPQTPTARLGLFAYMLGACGTRDDVAKLEKLLREPGDRFRGATSGLYAGLVMLDADKGWGLIHGTLADGKRPFTDRAAALSALRFFYNGKAPDVRRRAISGLKSLLPQGDIADLAIEDLRRWQLWDLNPDVLALYRLKSHDAPLMRRAVVRYALTCPDKSAKDFIASVRRDKPDLVHDVEESLEYEKVK